MTQKRICRRAAAAAGAAALLALSACAGSLPSAVQPGATEADVVARSGPPTGRYALPGGGTRLEYATGPFGKATWMIDVDAAGRVTAVNQVLTESSLMALQPRLDHMPREELLRSIGRPGEVRGGGWQGGEVWSWRYATNDCLWFQVSVADDGTTRGGTFGIDPACDVPSESRN